MPSHIELIDSHSHLLHAKFDADREEVLARSLDEGVREIIIPATEPNEFEELVRFSSTHQGVHYGLGIHPHHAGEVEDGTFERLEGLIDQHNPVAVGEIGLDYYYDFCPREQQRAVFQRQIDLAKKYDLPVVIHNRESDDDVLQMIEESQDGSLRFQLHCFSSTPEVLEKSLELGGMVSFTGNISFRNVDLDEVVRNVPTDRLMIETDAPYMTPVPHRGKRNEPAFVTNVAQKIAEIRNVSLEQVATMTTMNARTFFRLPVLLLLLIISAAPSLFSQGTTPIFEPDPDSLIDAPVERLDKLLSVGGHLTSTTFIVDRETQASTADFGFMVSIAPLQPVNRFLGDLHLDVIYTPTRVNASADSVTAKILEAQGYSLFSKNIHNTLDLHLRYEFKADSRISLNTSFGVTHFYNLYGIDQLVIDSLKDTIIGTHYDESSWGLSGGLGIGFNLPLSFGTFNLTGQLTFSSMLGDRLLERHGDVFQMAQTRIALQFYPHISSWLGIPVAE